MFASVFAMLVNTLAGCILKRRWAICKNISRRYKDARVFITNIHNHPSNCFRIHCLALQQQKKDKNANERGTMLLLRVQLIEYHTKYMRLGEIPSYAYQNFEEMYEAYHDLGGNGMVKKMYEEIKELHIKSGGGK